MTAEEVVIDVDEGFEGVPQAVPAVVVNIPDAEYALVVFPEQIVCTWNSYCVDGVRLMRLAETVFVVTTLHAEPE
jgi:hypothetical protein